MVCADTSCWIAYLAGGGGADVTLLEACLRHRALVMSPVVLSELLSDPLLPAEAESSLVSLPQIELTTGFWARAGKTRARLREKGYRPKLADTLIAQLCIDAGVYLMTRDRDFRSFARFAGLLLM